MPPTGFDFWDRACPKRTKKIKKVVYQSNEELLLSNQETGERKRLYLHFLSQHIMYQHYVSTGGLRQKQRQLVNLHKQHTSILSVGFVRSTIFHTHTLWSKWTHLCQSPKSITIEFRKNLEEKLNQGRHVHRFACSFCTLTFCSQRWAEARSWNRSESWTK